MSAPADNRMTLAVEDDQPYRLTSAVLERQAEVAARYQPVMDVDASRKRYKALKKYIEEVLVDGEDYGSIPGIEKPFLFKSGAQKLCMLFGYAPHYECLGQIEDWKGDKYGEPLFFYKFSCVLTKDRAAVGEGIGSANSWESKYRYRWVRDLPKDVDSANVESRSGTISEFAFAVNKAETSGQYGKPKEYWDRWHAAITSGEARSVKKRTSGGKEMDAWEMGGTLYRIPNDGFPDVINTVQKQAEKRAYVEATLSATGASQFFTQDEDSVEAQHEQSAPAAQAGRPADPTPPPQSGKESKQDSQIGEPQTTTGKEWLGGQTIGVAGWKPVQALIGEGNDWAKRLIGKRYGVKATSDVMQKDHGDLLQFASLLKAIDNDEQLERETCEHCGVSGLQFISPEKLSKAIDFVNDVKKMRAAAAEEAKPQTVGKLEAPY